MFALGTMAVIRNTVLNDAKRVFGVFFFTFVGLYLAIILLPPPWQEQTRFNVMCVFSPLAPVTPLQMSSETPPAL